MIEELGECFTASCHASPLGGCSVKCTFNPSVVFLTGERRNSEAAGAGSAALRLPRLLLRHLCESLTPPEAQSPPCISLWERPVSRFLTRPSPPLSPPQLLAVFRFASLIMAYAVCKLRHWWAIAVSLSNQLFPQRQRIRGNLYRSLIAEGQICGVLLVSSTSS